jgi:hypothetical protein
MAQIFATLFLVAVILAVLKMIWDVQTSKLNRFVNELEDYFNTSDEEKKA